MGIFKNNIMVQSSALLLTLSVMSFVQAAQDFDSSFNPGIGYVITSNGQGLEFNDAQVQGDGKIVVVGDTTNPNTQAVIARYTSTGVLDSTFGTGGLTTTAIGSSESTTVFQAAAIQPDGKIVAVGYTFDSDPTQIVVVRYTTAGALDGTFGTAGITLISVGDGASANAVALDGSHNILVAGTASSGGANVCLVRLTPGGIVDTGFGTGGVVLQLVGESSVANDVKFDGSGNIVVAGVSSAGFGDQYLLIRFDDTGALDATFGSGGIVVGSTTSPSVANSLAFDSSTNIVIGGYVESPDQMLLARYTSAGVLDSTFGSSGIVIQALGDAARIQEIAVQDDGNIICGGYETIDTDELVVVRYTSAGVLDTTFGESGIVTLSGREARSNALVLQPTDGRSVVAGFALDPASGESSGLVARLNRNNSDYIDITSITTPTITTKVPVLFGVSSVASAQVQVTINGVLTTTVFTDGSGNWTAGATSVLPIGLNIIQVDLVVSGTTLVSDALQVVVIDQLGEDGLHSFDTTTQTALTGSFSDVTFSTNAYLNTWAHTAGTASFTCGKAGTYVFFYDGCLGVVSDSGTISASMRLVKNGTEIPGSVAPASFTTSGTLTAGSILQAKKEVVAVLAVNDVVKLQALGSNAQLVSAGSGTTKPSVTILAIRIA